VVDTPLVLNNLADGRESNSGASKLYMYQVNFNDNPAHSPRTVKLVGDWRYKNTASLIQAGR